MKNRIKGIVVGLVIGFIISGTVLASVNAVKKDLYYKNIKITLDGKEIKPTDVNGNYIEPFIIEGTTYLPVRGISNALGLGVDWDGNTNTVILSSPDEEESTTSLSASDEQLLVNHAGVKITYVGYKHDSEGDDLYAFFIIENDSFLPIKIASKNGTVNGFKCNGIMPTDFILPGKKVATELFFYSDWLEGYGIKSFENLEVNFAVLNDELCEIYESGMIKITK